MIRNSVKALIIEENKILLIHCHDPQSGDYYALPGGGQNTYEPMMDALQRECLEETGYLVKPQRLAALCEEIITSPEYQKAYPEYCHKLYSIFLCKLVDNQTTKESQAAPQIADNQQIGVEWVELEKIDELRLLPRLCSERIREIIQGLENTWLGTEQ